MCCAICVSTKNVTMNLKQREKESESCILLIWLKNEFFVFEDVCLKEYIEKRRLRLGKM